VTTYPPSWPGERSESLFLSYQSRKEEEGAIEISLSHTGEKRGGGYGSRRSISEKE